MKKSLMPMLTMLFVVGFLGTQHAVADPLPKLYVDPPMTAEPSLGPGSSFSININVSQVPDLYGYEFKLSYQTSALTATSITLGSFFPPDSWIWWNYIDDEAGFAWYSVTMPLGSTQGVSGSGTLAIINFTVDDYGSSYLVLYETMMGNTGGYPITHELDHGYFTNVAPTFEANLARRSAWPEAHHYVVSKDVDGKITLYGKVKNTGTVKTIAKVVFTIYDENGIPVTGMETASVQLEVGEVRNLTYDWDGFDPLGMKYYVTAQAWYDSNGDRTIDTAGAKQKSFSFTVVP